MFDSTNELVGQNFSPILIVLKPILILCKCFGTCTLPVFKCSHLNQVKYVSTIYQIGFVIFCELNTHGVYKSFTSSEPLNMGTCFHVGCILLIVVCTLTDKKLLDVMTNVDAADGQIRPLLMNKAESVDDNGYKWVFCVIAYEVYLYLFLYCFNQTCDRSYIMTIVYRQMPFNLLTALFCCISTELCKRFKLLSSILRQKIGCCEDPKFLEECRDIHCKLTLATELFCQGFSARVTLLFFMITSHTISFFCFPCIHGEECGALFFLKGIVQELFTISVICYYASKINRENEDILDDLHLIPVNNSPYKCQHQIQLFSCQVVVRPLKVSALGLFDIDMTTILAVLSVVLMYTVIVAQLGDRLEPYMRS